MEIQQFKFKFKIISKIYSNSSKKAFARMPFKVLVQFICSGVFIVNFERVNAIRQKVGHSHRLTLIENHSISLPPPFCWSGQLSVPNFEKGRGIGKKLSAWGGLKEFLPCIFAREVLSKKKKKTFKNKAWLWGLNFKCWSWPLLVKQPIIF